MIGAWILLAAFVAGALFGGLGVLVLIALAVQGLR